VNQTGFGSFDELADDYQRFRIGYADEIYDLLREHAVGAGSRVLDLGCGTGLVSARLVAAGCIVTGVDPSEAMLAHARSRVPGATFVLASAEKLPFDADSFDAATCAQAFHWFDQRRALEELQRVVRPGGTLAVWWKGLMRGDPIRHVRVPWLTHMRVADYLGYERSRARARDAFGEQRGAYLDRLAARLGDPESTLSLNYLHYLYLARVPGEGDAA